MIIRGKEYYKYHCLSSDDAIKYGLESAAILGNIDKFVNIAYQDLYMEFPYIEKEKFYELLEILIEKKELTITKNQRK